jgi:hypothetical protein
MLPLLVSPYLNAPLRTLHDACHAMGGDDRGRACATCPVRDLCAAPAIKAGAAAVASQPSA